MSKTGGEGRTKAEKSQRVIAPADFMRVEREKRKAEEAEWESRSGPVEVRRKDV